MDVEEVKTVDWCGGVGCLKEKSWCLLAGQ